MRLNITLALKAMSAVTDSRFEDEPKYCQRWAREVRQAALGKGYDKYDRPRARDAGMALSSGGFSVPTSELGPGCLVFKLYRPDGHVGIYVGDVGGQHDLVAENSSTRIGRVRGAAGYRTLEQWGDPDLVICLPDPASAVVVLPDGQHLPGWGSSTILVPARAWGQAVSLPVGWRADLHRATVGGHVIDAVPLIVDGVGWVPVRLLAEAAGLRAVWLAATRRVAVTRG